jgi:hypothetical protein
VLLADPAFGAVAIGHAHKIAHAPTSSRPEMVHVIVPISTAEFVDTSVLNVISDDGSANSFTAWPCVPVVPMGAYIAGPPTWGDGDPIACGALIPNNCVDNAMLKVDVIADGADRGTNAHGGLEQGDRLWRRPAWTIDIGDAVAAARRAHMLAQQLTGLRIEQAHKEVIPLHVDATPDPAWRVP